MYCLSHFLLSFYVICYFYWKIVGIACEWRVLSENWERGVGVEVLGAHFKKKSNVWLFRQPPLLLNFVIVSALNCLVNPNFINNLADC